MGVFTRMAMAGGAHMGAAGVSLYRMWSTKLPSKEELQGAVKNAERFYKDQIGEETMNELRTLADGGKRRELADKLGELHDSGKLPSWIFDPQVKYSKEAVAHMRSEAKETLGTITQHLDRLEKALPKELKAQTLEELTNSTGGFLEKIDAKYKNLSKEALRARVKESSTMSYLGDVPKLKDNELQSLGFTEAQILEVHKIRDEIKAAKAEKKQLEKEGKSVDLTPANATKIQVRGHEIPLSMMGTAASPTGWAIAERLGIKPNELSDETVERMITLRTQRANVQLHLAKDLLHTLHAQRGTGAKIMVDLARIGQVTPEEFTASMKDLRMISSEIEPLAMAGRETLKKLGQVPEIEAAALMVVDQGLLGGGSLREGMESLFKNPDFEKTLNAAASSPEVAKHIDAISAELDRLKAMLDRVGAHR
jgi:hypothetical protein